MKNKNLAKYESVRSNAPKKTEAETMKLKQSKTNVYIPIYTQVLQDAEREIVKSVQENPFQGELACFVPLVKGLPRIAPH